MNTKTFGLLGLTLLTLTLVSCGTLRNPIINQSPPQNIKVVDMDPTTKMGIMSGQPVVNTGSLGGGMQMEMDEVDKQKLSRGLDGGLGKTTNWTSGKTHVTYSVTPIQKLTLAGNPFCRRYNLTATKGGNTQNFSGTACLESDGEWHPRN